jgi:hypothetical protein
MTINLKSYNSIETALFCRVDVPDYAVLRFSNYNIPVTINGESYTNLGTLLGVGDVSSDIRAAAGTLSVSITGIPNTSIAEVLSQTFKGSAIQIWRVFFDTQTKQVLNITGNPAGRFQGVITNFSLEEDWQQGATTTTNRITFTCSSSIDILSNKVAGRKTNSNDMKAWYPSDLSMDRVTTLAKSNYNFGAVIK